MEIPIDLVVFTGIFLAILCRTYFPYLKKSDTNRDNQNFAFQTRYIITAIISATVTAILIFNSFILPAGTPFQIFIASFVFAWGTNDLANSLVK